MRSPSVAVLLAWLLPGLGHLYLGRPRRGLFYAFVITLLFGVGIALQGRLSTPITGSYLSTLATFADLGSGLLYLGAQLLGLGAGVVSASTHEIGNTFHWSAGLLNLLLLLDAHDVAVGRK